MPTRMPRYTLRYPQAKARLVRRLDVGPAHLGAAGVDSLIDK